LSRHPAIAAKNDNFLPFPILLCMAGAAALMEQIEVQFEHVALAIAELDKSSQPPTDPIRSQQYSS